MTLQELLKSLGIVDEKILEINKVVDSLILEKTKNVTSDKIKELETKILTNKVLEIAKTKTDIEKASVLLKLINFDENDDEKSITKKIDDTLKVHNFLAKSEAQEKKQENINASNVAFALDPKILNETFFSNTKEVDTKEVEEMRKITSPKF